MPIQGELAGKSPSQHLADAAAAQQTQQPSNPPAEEGKAPDPIDSELDDLTKPEQAEEPASDSDSLFAPKEETEQNDATPVEANVRHIKANGQVHDVDLKDEKKLDQLLSLGLAARPLFSEVDRLRKDVGRISEELKAKSAKADAFAKLESVAHDPKELFRMITGGKVDWDQMIEQEAARKLRFQNASPEEQRVLSLEEENNILKRERERHKADIEQRSRDAEARTEAAKKQELYTKLQSEFVKHTFTDGDQVVSEGRNEILWNSGLDLAKKYAEKHGIQDVSSLPAETIRKIFSHTKRVMTGDAQQQVDKKVREVIDTKKAEAKSQAQVASSRNYSKPISEDLMKLAHRPTDLLKKLRS